jgi:hypothetical protein
MPAVRDSFEGFVLLLAVSLPEVDLLTRPKDRALPGRYI